MATEETLKANKPDDFIAPACEAQIEVLYQDDDLLLINKPSGLLSLSGKNPLNKDSLHHRLTQDFPSARLLHRLDFGTSGIMLVALNKAVNATLTQQFQNRTIKKRYTALLNGHLTADRGTIEGAIARGVFPRQKMCETDGKFASSDFEVLERQANPDVTRVCFSPLTGRTHQLRIHSQHYGHPIIGCDLYGTLATHALAARLMLHANYLAFIHPVTGEPFEMQCPAPF